MVYVLTAGLLIDTTGDQDPAMYLAGAFLILGGAIMYGVIVRRRLCRGSFWELFLWFCVENSFLYMYIAFMLILCHTDHYICYSRSALFLYCTYKYVLNVKICKGWWNNVCKNMLGIWDIMFVLYFIQSQTFCTNKSDHQTKFS